jgi:transcriptional antiterminator
MNFGDYQAKLNKIEKLAKLSNTGTPAELSQKLSVSERTVRRMVSQIKSQNIEINFCRKSKSYIIK